MEKDSENEQGSVTEAAFLLEDSDVDFTERRHLERDACGCIITAIFIFLTMLIWLAIYKLFT